MNTSTQALTTRPTGEMIENVIAKGDLSKLTPEERTQYYVQLCRSMGLNPHTQPFAFINLSGKLILYAKRDAADQLRKINGISIEVVNRHIEDGLFTVHVRAKDSAGRTDEDFGVVPLPDTLKGEMRANQILKAITKAKRRVTLSISGLGFLDETEVEDIPKQTARSRSAKIAQIEDPDERHAAAEAAHDEWAEKQAASLRRGLADRNAEINATHLHDADGVIHDTVWEEDGERPATAADEADTGFVDLATTSSNTGIWKASYIESVRERIRKAMDGPELRAWLESEEQKKARRDFVITDEEWKPLSDFAIIRLRELRRNGAPK